MGKKSLGNKLEKKNPDKKNLQGKNLDKKDQQGQNQGRKTAAKGNREKEVWKPGNMLYPLPAIMVSCQRAEEKPNIITIAWAGTVCSSPAMLSI